MKRTIIITLFTFVGYFNAFSQNNLSQTESAPSAPDSLGKYELGVNTYFAFDRLFDQSVQSPVELMIRKRLSPDHKLRLRVFGDIQRSKRVEFTTTDENHRSSYGLAIGYEWIKPISKKWQGYYGLELEGNQSRSTQIITDTGYDPDADPYTFWEKNRTYYKINRLAFSPFAGIGYSLSQRLFLSTEFRLVNSMEWQEPGVEKSTKPLESDLDFQIQTSSGSTITQRGIRFRPYTGIFLNYRF